MFVDFQEVFNPSPEKIAQYNKTFVEVQKNAIKKKKCWMCKNTYGEYWNNHGHDDETKHCVFSKECIDFSDGKKCPNWSPKEIQTLE